jgi:hypothetical protein
LHGGKSTGRPIVHGRHTKRAIAERKYIRNMLRLLRALIAEER